MKVYTTSKFKKTLKSLHKNDPTLKVLDLSSDSGSSGLAKADIHLLAQALKINTTLISLDLSNNMSHGCAQDLFEMLKENKTLASLNLSSSRINHEDTQGLAEALKKNKALTHIDLSLNNISDGVEDLAEALKGNKTLTHLDLHFSCINEVGAKDLAEALKKNNALVYLNLRENRIGCDGAQSLAEALIENRSLARLDLYQNNVRTVGAKYLAEALKKNKAVTNFDLSYNNIDADGAEYLAEALKENKALTNFNLCGNNISDVGVKYVSLALLSNKSLIKLNISGNNISGVGAKYLIETLDKNETLVCLDFSNNNVSNMGKDIKLALRANKSLTSFDINGTCINDEIQRSNYSICKKNAELRESLFRTVKSGDLGQMEIMFDKGVSVLTTDDKNNSLLHWAIICNKPADILNFLYVKMSRYHTNPLRIENWYGKTPLAIAKEKGYEEIVQLLAEFNEKFLTNKTTKFLLKSKKEDYDKVMANYNDCNHYDSFLKGESQMQITTETEAVIRYQNLQNLVNITPNSLIDAVEISQQQGTLWRNIAKEDLNAVKVLIKQDRSLFLNLRDSLQHTPLHTAVLCSRQDLVTYFIKTGGIDIAACNRYGLQAIHMAAYLGQFETVQALTDVGAANIPVKLRFAESVSVASCELDCTPLHLAILRGHKEIVGYLLNFYKGTDVWLAGFGNVLHLAVLSRQDAMLAYLLTHEAIIKSQLHNQPDVTHRTPLSLAAETGNILALRRLCECNKVDKLYINQDGRIALHFAVLGAQEKAVKVLLKQKSDIHATDKDNLTPVDLAIKLQNQFKDNQSLYGDYNLIIADLRNWKKFLVVNAYKALDLTNKKQRFRNLVFEGGGPKGIAYLGAVRVLHTNNRLEQIRRVAGTSAGAITALLVALNFSIADLENILRTLSVEAFLEGTDVSAFQGKDSSKIRTTMKALWTALKSSYQDSKSYWDYLNPWQQLTKLDGLCSGEYFRNWIEKLIENKLQADKIDQEFGENYIKYLTFGQLCKLAERGKNYKALYVVTTCISGQQAITVINSDDDLWKDVIVSDAIRASMSIPGVFKPHQLYRKHIKETGQVERVLFSQDKYVDGGMLKNYPLEIFDKLKYQQPHHRSGDPDFPIFNDETFGFSLYTPQPEHVEVESKLDSASSVAKALFHAYFESEQLLANLNKSQRLRTIYISNENVGTLDFDLDASKQNQLITAGEEAAKSKFRENTAQSAFRERNEQTLASLTHTTQVTSEKKVQEEEKSSLKLSPSMEID